MKIVLKKPKKKIKLGRVFKKAVAGYKLTRPIAKPQQIEGPFQFLPAQFPQPPQEEASKAHGGISLTESVGTLKIKESDVDLRQINLMYNLIPSETGEPFASAHIKWSHTDSSVIYNLGVPLRLYILAMLSGEPICIKACCISISEGSCPSAISLASSMI